METFCQLKQHIIRSSSPIFTCSERLAQIYDAASTLVAFDCLTSLPSGRDFDNVPADRHVRGAIYGQTWLIAAVRVSTGATALRGLSALGNRQPAPTARREECITSLSLHQPLLLSEVIFHAKWCSYGGYFTESWERSAVSTDESSLA